MTRRLLREIITKEFLLERIKEGMTQEEVVSYIKNVYNINISRSSVYYWMRRYGLQWGQRKNEPVDLDVDALIEATEIVSEVWEKINNEKIYWEKKEVEEKALHILIGDVHVGAYYEAKGKVDWTKTIPERMSNFKKGIEEFINKSVTRPSIIYIDLLGDLIDGYDVYPAQTENSHPLIYEQIDLFIKEFMELVFSLRAIAPVKIFAVQGNHGRINFKTEYNNWDTFIYTSIKNILEYYNKGIEKIADEQSLDEQEKITIDFARKYLLRYKDLFGHKILLGHGHKILKNSALSNISKINEFIMNRNFMGYEHDIFIMGHVHQSRFWSLGHKKYYIANGTAYDSDHFHNTIGLPTELSFIIFTSTKNNPIDELKIIPLVGDDYYG